MAVSCNFAPSQKTNLFTAIYFYAKPAESKCMMIVCLIRLWSIQEEVENQWQGIQIEIASTDENIRFEFVATSPTPSLVEIDDVKVNYSACGKLQQNQIVSL